MKAISYDHKPYKTYARKECDPNRMGAIARLYGVEAAAPNGCRLLEIGCGTGGNIIPLAERYPGSTFLGIDLSLRHIIEARQVTELLGLKNIEWICADIKEYRPERAGFDYIVAHGIYSWISDELQGKLLELCSSALSKSGVAFVSYNVLPGWRQRGAVRDVMMFGASIAGGLDPDEQLRGGLKFLELVASTRNDPNDPYGSYLQEALCRLKGSESSYLMHEFLAEYNLPCLFSDFIKRAEGAGLQFLSEARVSLMSSDDLGPDVADFFREISSDIIAREQALDIFRNRTFRESLLCHTGQSLQRDLKASVFRQLFFSTTYRQIGANGANESRFVELVSGREVQTPSGIIAEILGVVGTYGSVGATPEEIRLKAVADLSATLNEADIISSLVSLWRSGFIEVTCDRPLLALASVGKPRAPEYSRMQAQAGELATSLRHEALQLSPIEREIIIRSSGEQEATAIINELSQDHPRDTVKAAYDRLVQLGFLLL